MLPTTLDLLQKSYRLYRANKKLFWKYTAVLAIPILITSVYRFFLREPLSQNPSLSLQAVAIIVIFILYLFTLWTSLALVRVIYRQYQNQSPLPVRQELTSLLRVIPTAVLVTILTGLAIFGGLIIFIIPGLIFSIWFFFSLYGVALDEQKGLEALRWSKRLVQGRWWEVLWLLLSTSFLLTLGLILLQSGLRFLTRLTLIASPPTLSREIDFVYLLIATIIHLLLTPIFAAVPAILYSELKKIKNL